MKHALFKPLGEHYPIHLEREFDRILTQIEELWDTDKIHDFFSDLILDKRGGRKGFPKPVMNEIIMLRDLRESETIRKAESREDAQRELEILGFHLKKEEFFQFLNHGDKALIDLFVRAGFNVNCKDEQGNPPLLIALRKGYTVIAHIILNAGADVNVKDSMGLTPLLMTCGKQAVGYKRVAENLINKGALINVQDRLGYTPLLLALSGGTAEIAELLIEKGANVSISNRKQETALMLASRMGNNKLVDFLISKGATK